jgi:tetratricopeptide (TPR) repeat protein
MRVLGEHVSGFIDFDFAGRKRRLFFDEGKAFSAQSGVPGEGLLDLLIARKKLKAEDKAAVLQLARDKKVPVEQAIIDAGKVSEPDTLMALRGLVELVVKRSLDETSGSYKLSLKAGLLARMKGTPVEMMGLLQKEEVSDVALDPNVLAARKEIREAFEKQKALSHYELLGVSEKATADEIRKKYFDMAKKWHTDRFGKLAIGDEAKEQLESLFAQISEAQSVLTDAAKRADYDAILDRKKKGLPTDVAEIMKAEAAFTRGEQLLERGQPEAALKELTQATSINPGESEFWAVYGLALYFVEKNPGPAITAAQKALELNPKLARAYECMGRIYKAEGDNTKARSMLQKCLDLDPKNIHAQRELRLMAMRADSAKHAPVKNEGNFLTKLFKR